MNDSQYITRRDLLAGAAALACGVSTQRGYATLKNPVKPKSVAAVISIYEPGTHADVLIVNADIPDEEVFANLTDVNKTKPKPIVMFTEESNSEMASSAIKSGVNAYIVDGLEENRVQPIIDVAMARFREFQALKDELDATRNKLSERKVVEKAKGLLMKHKDINEDEAYQSLRKMAMDKNKRIVDVAESVINAFELLE